MIFIKNFRLRREIKRLEEEGEKLIEEELVILNREAEASMKNCKFLFDEFFNV